MRLGRLALDLGPDFYRCEPPWGTDRVGKKRSEPEVRMTRVGEKQ